MRNKIYIVMGVSGCGKSTIGKLLSEKIGIYFYDGDDFHPQHNVKKMSQGIPLNDEDRQSWLISINEKVNQIIANDLSAVFACSALKESYRNLLSKKIEHSITWIFLKGEKKLIENRMEQRAGHYMPSSLLQSQFDILEEPSYGIKINIENDTKTIIQKIMQQIETSTFGIVGLGVMGKSLARNFANKGVELSLFNRHVKDVEELVAKKCIEAYSELQTAKGFDDMKLFINSLAKPRKIFLMIKAGAETDIFIEELLPFLETGDIVIDGGNSHFEDTKKRISFLESKGIHFIGTGVSGGEKGALNGPSIMPSGSQHAYKIIEPYFNLIAAKDKDGIPCSAYIGQEGSGHFVKMIHNGIEYAEMQLIAEVYSYLRYVLQMSPDEISSTFTHWNETDLKSYLLEITISILVKKEKDNWLIDLILDAAGNKGTGNWATISASEIGFPSTMITSALFARYLSTLKETATYFKDKNFKISRQEPVSLNQIQSAYRLARIVNHQQGFAILKSASEKFSWTLNLSEISRVWTNGCIIRSALMEKFVLLFKQDQDVFSNVVFKTDAMNHKQALKDFCLSAIHHDLPIACHCDALEYLNVLRANYASANIIQAQRDCFGAHTYQKVGDISGIYYHTEW